MKNAPLTPSRRGSWALLLVAVAGVVGQIGTARALGEQSAATPDVAQSLNPLSGLSIEKATAFVQRPLFSTDRKPYYAPRIPKLVPVAPPAAPSPTTQNLRLLGTIQMATGSVARIQDIGQNTTRSIKAGETVGGWKLTSIGASFVRFEQAGVTSELQLFEGGSKPIASSLPALAGGRPAASAIPLPRVTAAPATTRALPSAVSAAGQTSFALTIGTATAVQSPSPPASKTN